jgi:hypothetical protein
LDRLLAANLSVIASSSFQDWSEKKISSCWWLIVENTSFKVYNASNSWETHFGTCCNIKNKWYAWVVLFLLSQVPISNSVARIGCQLLRKLWRNPRRFENECVCWVWPLSISKHRLFTFRPWLLCFWEDLPVVQSICWNPLQYHAPAGTESVHFWIIAWPGSQNKA